MKKILLVLIALLSVGSIIVASTSNSNIDSYNNYESPQVCQFSLSKYTGKISSDGYTENITVRISCPQTEDVYATVVVTIDNDLIASQVVKIPANSTQSSSVSINVGRSYSGKSYKLGVQ